MSGAVRVGLAAGEEVAMRLPQPQLLFHPELQQLQEPGQVVIIESQDRLKGPGGFALQLCQPYEYALYNWE